MKIKLASIGLLCLTAGFVLAEPSQLAKVHGILQLPLPNRLQVFQQKPEQYFTHLKNIFYSKKIDESVKWKALMSMARLYPKKSRYVIRRALKSKGWFMKNAGLIALEITDSKKSLLYARQFLEHPSLVLRTAAVDLIRRQKATQYIPVLWKKLYAKESFRKGKGLWIRRNIVMALSELTDAKDKERFIALLSDSDSKVYNLALMTLNQWGGNISIPERKQGRAIATKRKSILTKQPVFGKRKSSKSRL